MDENETPLIKSLQHALVETVVDEILKPGSIPKPRGSNEILRLIQELEGRKEAVQTGQQSGNEEKAPARETSVVVDPPKEPQTVARVLEALERIERVGRFLEREIRFAHTDQERNRIVAELETRSIIPTVVGHTIIWEEPSSQPKD